MIYKTKFSKLLVESEIMQEAMKWFWEKEKYKGGGWKLSEPLEKEWPRLYKKAKALIAEMKFLIKQAFQIL